MTERLIKYDARGVHVGNMASFGGADPGTKYPLRAWGITAKVTTEMHAIVAQKTAGPRGPDGSVVGAEGGTVSLSVPLRGAELSAGGMGTAELSRLMGSAGMVESSVISTPNEVDSATSNSITDTFGGALDVINVGDMIMVKTATLDQMRMVISKSGATSPVTLGVYPDFDVTPANGDDIFAVKTYTPINGEPSAYLGMDVYAGQDSTNRWLLNLLSCAGKWSIPDVAVGAVPNVLFEFMADSYTASEANIAQVDETFLPAWPLKGSCAWLAADAKTKIGSFGFDPGITQIPIASTCGTEGRAGWFYKDPEPKLTITPYHDNDFWTGLDAGTKYQFFFESTIDETRSWALYIGAMQITNLDHVESSEGLLGVTPEFQICDPGLNADGDQLPMFAFGITA